MNRLETLFEQRPAPADFARGYLEYVAAVLRRIDPDAVAAFISTLAEARERRATVYFIGNGGSAATASHFANDLAIGTRSLACPFKVVSLADNMPVITAIANDFGYAEVFLQQLQVLLRPGDVVVAISASGNSPNILKAVAYANEHGATTVGLTSFDGGRLKDLVKLQVHVPAEPGEFGPAEDGHMVLDHLVGNFLRLACAQEARVR